MYLSECEFIAFDFETTGTQSRIDRIIEIGAVRFSLDGNITDQFSTLVNPKRTISPRAIEVHGITDQEVSKADEISEVLPKFLSFLDTDSILIAHNASFDRSFLAEACKMTGNAPPVHDVICSLPLCRRAWSNFQNYRLETIGQSLGLIEQEAHRGLDDSLLLAKVFTEAVSSLALKTNQELFRITKPRRVAQLENRQDMAPLGFELFETAITSKADMAIQYGDYSRAFRTVTPETIIDTGNQTYLMAICHRDGITKQFRFDRIHEFHLIKSTND